MIKKRVLLAVVVDIEVETEENARQVLEFARNTAKHSLRETAALALCDADITDMHFTIGTDPSLTYKP